MNQAERITHRLVHNTRLHFSGRTVPVALAFICIVAFGLLIPSLGFYQDDWHPVYYGYARGLSSLQELFAYDGRPFAALIFQIAFPLIGFKPLHWHLLALTLRVLTVLFTWLYLREIWPEHRRQVTWAALLFAVYPLFKLQALSLIYTIHWTGFVLFSISIWAMVQSIRKPRYFWPFTLLSVLAGGLDLLILEYFAGVELARPVILYLLLRQKDDWPGPIWRRVLKYWSPYLLMLVAFGIYRVFFLPGPETGSVANQPILVRQLLETPLTTGLHLIQLALQDTTAILVSVWYQVISPAVFTITDSAHLISLLVALFVIGIAFFYLFNLSDSEREVTETSEDWSRHALLLGLLITVLGPLPAWLTDQAITTDNPLWSDRFGLASMIGASLVVVALLEILVSNRDVRLLIFTALLGFSVGWHVFNTNEYRHSWYKQTDFFWQLYWRAPYIQPDTALLSNGEIFPRMGEYPTAFALSTLYPKPQNTTSLNYYFYSLSKHFDTEIEDLIQGMPLQKAAYSSTFRGDSRDSLVISYLPETYECLWVLRPEDTHLRSLPDIVREVTVISNLDRIQPDSPLSEPVPAEIFGAEPAHTWCYYYQKADLARQVGDWERIVDLWKQAAANGYSPGNGVEYLPFIEGFARTGQWKTAEEMTLQANENARVMPPILCPTWEKIAAETPSSANLQEFIASVNAQLLCP